MTTAIVGIGNIGSTVAKHLVAGGEQVVLAARDTAGVAKLADELGPLAPAATVPEAIAAADTVVFAVWLDTMRELIPQHTAILAGKVVVDPTNPLTFENGQFGRSLPDGQTSGDIVAGLLPDDARFVKAFGTLAADALATAAHREPHRAVLFYATDDDIAAATIERLIRAAGFDPLKVGGTADAGRIEAPTGDLHQFGFQGELVDLDQARAAVADKAARTGTASQESR